MSSSIRSKAADAIAEVLGGRSLDQALERALSGTHSGRDRALLQMLCYGVLRDLSLLRALANTMLRKPIEDAPQFEALLLLGLYQLRSTRIAPHAAVAQTVEACNRPGRQGHKAVVNAVLRRYLRERDQLERRLPKDPAQALSYPQWLVDAIRTDWPEQWRQVLTQGNVQAPMSLRVNRRRLSRDQLVKNFSAAGIAAQVAEQTADGLVLETPHPLEQLPGFAEGHFSVQDLSAQLAVDLLDVADGMRVLDACAAPGGKTAHILERAEVELLALDVDAQRLQRVEENLTRLQLHAQTQVLDARRLKDRWSGPGFDRILLDAPCSGTGVIRRHPDIKWLRRQSDIEASADAQLELLQSLWPMLAAGGLLVYATCSVLRAEGEAIARRFLKTQANARHLPIEATWGQAQGLGRRIAPGDQWDGFYYLRLQKPQRRK
ncbi:MAG: 16S rRNA (cytosine(967)-C(5))-methyltransferase RsmB [Panacagrimonas sp.]